jgi:hypothetical protein
LQNVKYIKVTPGPDKLPEKMLIIENARIVE